MHDAALLAFMKEGLAIAAACAAPLLLTCLVTGAAVSLLQALTQVQDQSVAYVPKLAAASAVLALAGPAAFRQVAAFARAVFEAIGGM
jgi:flagellar biosynthetic protein FliQ